ncbi:MAG: glucose-6-phosphate isomerase, partial [Calditrichaeota bacterium]
GVKQGYLDLHVLDSTDPGMVLEYKNNLKPEDTLYIVSTKSGTTVETLSFMKYFFTEAVNVLGKEKAGQHFIAITDPGSKLVDMANDLKFRKIFLNDPEVGGRYSALTYFGLVPAALVGVDLEKLLSRAQTMADLKEKYETPAEGDISAARLGVIMGDLAAMGRDKLTLILSPDIEHFATWVEQLIAESTGKEGKGILPVVGEKILEPVFYAPDRLFVYIKMKNDSLYDPDIRKLINAGHPVVQLVLDDLYDLGREFFRWELATAIAGWRLGINPFDQPNVEAAKKLAKKMMQEYTKKGKLPAQQPVLHHNNMKIFADFTAESFMDLLKIFLEKAEQGIHRAKGRSYIAIQAYIKPEVQLEEAFQRMRTEIRRLMKMATTFGYGPRFLHSTGQLHKGDAGNGLFIQFTSEMPRDVPIPDEPGKSKSSFSFAVLKTAQQLGDQQALQEAG